MEKTTINHLVDYLDREFHPELQEDYDNAGFLLGDGHMPYSGTLVALDLTPATVAEAKALGLNLIVTHHPFIFSGLRRITDRSETGRMALDLVRSGIAVYAAHTNLDNLPWGVNGALCNRLGLQNTRILKPSATDPNIGAGMVGDLRETLPADEFLLKIKSVLQIPMVRCSAHDGQAPVKRVALCGGSGSQFIPDALSAHADLYLTADLKYHDFQRAEGRIILADAGHYETEQFAKEIISQRISQKFCNFACRISSSQESIVRYI